MILRIHQHESTNEDIVNIYWSELITNYTSTLVTSTISVDTTISNANISDYTWPITINGGSSGSPIVITFGDDITLNSSSQYFIIGSEYITIEGGNNTVIINGAKPLASSLVYISVSYLQGNSGSTVLQ